MFELETFGRVFFPDPQIDEIGGARLYTKNEKIFLEFDYAFLKQPDKTTIILGRFNSIGKVTCLYNIYYGGTAGSGGNLCKYRVTTLFSGHHFIDIEDIKFNIAIIPANTLFNWFNIRMIKMVTQPNRAIQFGDFKSININTQENINASFNFGYRQNTNRESHTISEYVTIKIECDEPKNYRDFISVLIKLKKLFSFISVNTLNPESILFYSSKIKSEFGGKEVDQNKEIKYLDIRKEINPCPTSEFLDMKFIDIQEIFSEFVGQWISFSESNPVIDFLLEKAYNNELSYKTYFLNVCFALEIFHKNFVSNKKLTDDEFQYIKTHLKEKVNDNLVCKWLQSKLSIGNHPSFRDRLKYFEDDFKIIQEDTTLLINQIINTRNYLVHSGAKKQYVINDELKLLVIAMTLETIIKGSVLKILGVDSADVVKMYNKAKAHLIHLLRINT